MKKVVKRKDIKEYLQNFYQDEKSSKTLDPLNKDSLNSFFISN